MKDYYNEYSSYFKEYEDKQKDIDLFRSEINSIINYIYNEIQYSKKYIRFKKNGIETDYQKDLISFENNINFYKSAFIGDDIEIKYPKRLSYIFTINFNYLKSMFKIKDKTILDVFEVIRDEIFNIKKAPSLAKEKKNIKSNILVYMESFLSELRNEYPTLSDDEILSKIFTK